MEYYILDINYTIQYFIIPNTRLRKFFASLLLDNKKQNLKSQELHRFSIYIELIVVQETEINLETYPPLYILKRPLNDSTKRCMERPSKQTFRTTFDSGSKDLYEYL
jgi:hypothetical protein